MRAMGNAGHEMNVRVDGQLVFGTAAPILTAVRAGLGFAHLTEEQARYDLESGPLVRALGDWCPPFLGYHLLSQPSPADAGLRLAR